MSLFRPEELRIGLSPDRVDLVRIKRGWRGVSVSGQHSIACAPAAGDPPWSAAIAALAPALAQARGGARRARVVLSDHFVRYLLVPWRTDLRNEGEIEALARMRFKEIHGSTAETWELRLAPTRFGAPYVACAVDRQLLRALSAAHATEKLRLASVRPLLVATYNRWRKTRAAGDGWLAVCSRGRLTLCRIESGAWRSVRSEKSSGEFAHDLQFAIERESLALAIDPAGAALHLFAPEEDCPNSRLVAGIAPSVINPPPGVESRYALALA